ncbi:putative phytochrome B [Forsythia ovata]|uniref:Phytochrome B n=1 Tax=Forsythia ovata TaxID=205694 RepID=A0ABD1RQR3_9LAMI
MDEWKSVLLESVAASLSQEQSILRWIMGDVDDPSMGRLNKILQIGSGPPMTAADFEFNGGLIETATAPIFAVDIKGQINGWNANVAELTGLSVEEAIGKSLVHDLVHKESEEAVDKLLFRALGGEEDRDVEIKLKTFGTEQHKKAVFLVVNACSSKDYTNNIVGVCFVG